MTRSVDKPAGERMSKGRFEAGDPCFAKVKGWIPYPAKILGKVQKVKKEKYSVLFYGTKETADVDLGSIWCVTPVCDSFFSLEKEFQGWIRGNEPEPYIH